MQKNFLCRILIFFILAFLCASFCILAHPGYTDSNGGHWDRKNGTYHYHSAPNIYNKEYTYYVTDNYDEADVEGYDAGYDDGYSIGYDEGHLAGSDEIYDEAYDEGYNTGYEEGYEEAFDIGYEDGYEEGYEVGYDEMYSNYSEEKIVSEPQNSDIKPILYFFSLIAIVIILFFVVLLRKNKN